MVATSEAGFKAFALDFRGLELFDKPLGMGNESWEGLIIFCLGLSYYISLY